MPSRLGLLPCSLSCRRTDEYEYGCLVDNTRRTLSSTGPLTRLPFQGQAQDQDFRQALLCCRSGSPGSSSNRNVAIRFQRAEILSLLASQASCRPPCIKNDCTHEVWQQCCSPSPHLDLCKQPSTLCRSELLTLMMQAGPLLNGRWFQRQHEVHHMDDRWTNHSLQLLCAVCADAFHSAVCKTAAFRLLQERPQVLLSGTWYSGWQHPVKCYMPQQPSRDIRTCTADS